MARRRAIAQNEYPYHVSSRCINREWFAQPLDEVWNVLSEELYLARQTYDVEIHAFVLMSNHYHLICSTPFSNISPFMRQFSGNSSRRLTKAADRINQTFAGRHFKSILGSAGYFTAAYKYVYRNPVQAELCTRVEDYPYSTLSGLLGQQRLLIPVVEDTLLFSNVSETLDWLNRTPDAEKLEAVRVALRRTFFKSKKFHSNGRLIFGENDTL